MIASIVAMVFAAASNWQTVALPVFLNAFVGPGARPIEVATGDLNGDGLADYVVVLEKPTVDDDPPRAERTLLVLVKTKKGFRLAARSENAIRSDDCGGPLGDCFESVEAGARSIVINEFGGSSWRWSSKAVFRYSKRDVAWELVRYETRSFNVSDPDTVNDEILTPKQFGKVKIEDYDEEELTSPKD